MLPPSVAVRKEESMKSQLYRWNLGMIVMGAAMVWTLGTAAAVQSPQLPLAATAIPQFVQPLPILSVQTGGTMQTLLGNQPVTLRMCEFKSNVLPAGAVAGYAGTWVWGYLPDNTGTSTCGQ